MSKTVRALRMLALAVVLTCLTAVPALAADYRYTVRVFAGNKGEVNGQEVYVVSSDFAYGDSCTVSKDWVSVNDDKYYVKGFRISGQDGLCTEKFTVTEDTDLVVAYGVMGEMTTYTINFVEYGTGNALTSDAGRSSVTFTGKVGDKPVVAAEYIPGYRPLYNNITGTLKAGENVWTLQYVRIETQQSQQTTNTTTTTTTTTTSPSTTTTTSTVNGGGASTSVTGSSTTGTSSTDSSTTSSTVTDDESTTTTSTTTDETETSTAPETEEILDVDNPLASGSGQLDSGTTSNQPQSTGIFATIARHPVITTFVALVVAALITLLFLVFRDEDEDEEEFE